KLDWSRIEIETAELYLYDEGGELVSADSSSGATAQEPLFESLVAEAGMSVPGRMVLPLVMMNQQLGLIVLQFDADRVLTSEERVTFHTIAERFAGALERSRIYERARD